MRWVDSLPFPFLSLRLLTVRELRVQDAKRVNFGSPFRKPGAGGGRFSIDEADDAAFQKKRPQSQLPQSKKRCVAILDLIWSPRNCCCHRKKPPTERPSFNDFVTRRK